MQQVLQPPGIRKMRPQADDFARLKTRFFPQLATTGFRRILPRVDQSGRQFPGIGFHRGPVLPHKRDQAVRRLRKDSYIIGLRQAVICFGLRAPSEFDGFLNEADPG